MTDNQMAKNVAPSEFQDLIAFWRSYDKTIVTIVCIALALGGTVALYITSKRSKMREASTKLFSSQGIKEFKAIVEEYPDSPAAPLALLKLAKIYFNAGQYDPALDKYDEFLNQYPDHQFVLVARLGQIHCLEAKGLVDHALTAFTDFVVKHPNHFLTPQAILGKARCLEQSDQPHEARVIYEDFLMEHPESGWCMRIRERLAVLERKLGKKTTEDSEENKSNDPPKDKKTEQKPASD